MEAIASAAIRNNHAEPSISRSEISRRGSNCGNTTRSIRVQVDAPRVCAFTSSSTGISRARCSRSRARHGLTPMTMSITLDNSPRPNTMNRIGRIASGGTIDSTVSNGDNGAPNNGNVPAAMPRHRPARALMPRPSARRRRLDALSCHSTYSPVRLSALNARRLTASSICPALGSSLSLGLSARRSAEPTK